MNENEILTGLTVVETAIANGVSPEDAFREMRRLVQAATSLQLDLEELLTHPDSGDQEERVEERLLTVSFILAQGDEERLRSLVRARRALTNLGVKPSRALLVQVEGCGSTDLELYDDGRGGVVVCVFPGGTPRPIWTQPGVAARPRRRVRIVRRPDPAP